jgi:hypothetical protein
MSSFKYLQRQPQYTLIGAKVLLSELFVILGKVEARTA